MTTDFASFPELVNNQRPRVLLQAYACSPYRGGEPGMGWNRVLEMARYFDTWVLCKQQRYEPDIRKYFAEQGHCKGLHFQFVPRTRFEKLLKRIPGLFYLAYNLWVRRAYRVALKLYGEHPFDLIHQVNFNSYREPGYLWKLNVPFIWGPVGGTQNYPWRFLHRAGLGGAVVEGLRNIVNNLQFRFSPRVRAAARRAEVLLTANSEGKADFERVHKLNSILLLETGICVVEEEGFEHTIDDGPLKILWSGVFGHKKALHLLLEALSRLPETARYELRILGRGPLEKRWKKIARKVKVEANCTWLGWLPYYEALNQYKWADLFVFTSLRDTSGNVVLEALSWGVPVICLDHQGAGDIVTPECGIKIPVTIPQEVISGLRDALLEFSQNKDILVVLSRGALQRAQKYLWSRNGEQMAEIYFKVLRSQARNGR